MMKYLKYIRKSVISRRYWMRIIFLIRMIFWIMIPIELTI